MKEPEPHQPGGRARHGRVYVAGAGPRQGSRSSHRSFSFGVVLYEMATGAAFSRRHLRGNLRCHPEPYSCRTGAAQSRFAIAVGRTHQQGARKRSQAAMPNCWRDARRPQRLKRDFSSGHAAFILDSASDVVRISRKNEKRSFSASPGCHAASLGGTKISSFLSPSYWYSGLLVSACCIVPDFSVQAWRNWFSKSYHLQPEFNR